jgi:hypothetical protein
MPSLHLRLILLASLLSACPGTRDRPRGSPRPPGGGTQDASVQADAGTPDSGPAPEATECLEAASCVETTDCPAGSRCNLALAPPRCQQLFCGGAGTACSEDSLCQTMHICREGACRPCVDCGGICVETDSDPQHCGGCNMPVGANQECVNGQPVCAGQGFEQCGDECVSTETSLQHCGGCNRPCAASCLAGTCVELASMEGGTPTSCTSLCSSIQRSCVVLPEIPLPDLGGPGAGVASYDDQVSQMFYALTTCQETAPATHDGLPYFGMACFCSTQ